VGGVTAEQAPAGEAVAEAQALGVRAASTHIPSTPAADAGESNAECEFYLANTRLIHDSMSKIVRSNLSFIPILLLQLQMRPSWRRMLVQTRRATAAAAATGAARPWSSAPWWPSSSGARRSRASQSLAASRCVPGT
jgi:hypothetical protein